MTYAYVGPIANIISAGIVNWEYVDPLQALFMDFQVIIIPSIQKILNTRDFRCLSSFSDVYLTIHKLTTMAKPKMPPPCPPGYATDYDIISFLCLMPRNVTENHEKKKSCSSSVSNIPRYQFHKGKSQAFINHNSTFKSPGIISMSG